MHSIVFYYCTPDILATITGIKPFAEEILGPPVASVVDGILLSVVSFRIFLQFGYVFTGCNLFFGHWAGM